MAERGNSRLGRPQGGTRWRALALVAMLHLLLIGGLIEALTPRIRQRMVSATLTAFAVMSPPPAVEPPVPAVEAPEPARPAGAAAPKATARPAAALSPRIVIAALDAQVDGGNGPSDASGSVGAGRGTGAGGNGSGVGGGQHLVQIGGAINSAQDYPAESRDKRIGTSVVIVFTVGTDGRAHDCRVRDPSGDPRADTITCRLAEQRFRFRPATDAAGNPIPAPYGWKQSWFY